MNDDLRAAVAKLERGRGDFWAEGSPWLQGGVETRRAGDAYHWDGRKRGGDPARPFFVFQYTLEGEGALAAGRRRWRLGPGGGFFAVVPSPGVYWLPENSAGWRFFFLVVRHPFVVARIARLVKSAGPAPALPADSLPVTQALGLLTAIARGEFAGRLEEEHALLRWMMECERHVAQALWPRAPRARLLGAVRAAVQAEMGRRTEVARLARAHGMSRSHFGHHFKAVTGLSPGRFAAQVRLQAAGERLARTDAPLKQIAAETGFADANHLCKAFRRHYHLSPGAFRRQAR